ncbi:serine/threonine protein kinase [Mycolicibacterium sp. GF69]|uniref:protein kinase domain-containing protein n=1 Tax=Mycolicibacterium sp. GF69 TaxID=2267251 RepID=UPI000DCCE9FE|nr:protein kinase [Mycolicibacterium sp. GF69]RAV06237.1 serine/threonine protein kinase [Mycolicibacterium sp. GF69]
MSLGEGQKFAGYMVVRRLGAGGMGEVYLVQHPRLPRHDALKLLTGDITADSNFRERFLREADLASTLWHPHIVGVHDRGEHEGQLWISMDFVDGEDAASLLARRYPAGMPAETAAAIVSAVASALDYAHHKGLLHRDVKPSNILITPSDSQGEQRILLTDFGIARTVDDNSGLTDTNMTVGTVDYAAPEQLMGEDIDGRADQYSLAATAFHLLTGAPPFRDSNAAVVIGRHLNSDPPTLTLVRPELESLDHVLAAALAKDRERRFSTCTDFANALSEQVSGSGASSTLAAATAHAPIKRPDKESERPRPPGPLPPGWYPDPGGGGGTLYWDGRGWLTAPLPKADKRDGGAVGAPGRNRSGIWLLVVGIAAAAAIVTVALVAVGKDDSNTSEPSALTTPPFTEPTYPTERPPRRTAVTTPPTREATTHTETVTVAPRTGAPPSPTSVPYWTAIIVGTCDEGGSCGVKQRRALHRCRPAVFERPQRRYDRQSSLPHDGRHPG